MNTAQAGDLAMLVARDHKHFILRLEPGTDLQTHRGVVHHDDMIGGAWGSMIQSHMGNRFFMVQPSLHDILLSIRRSSQIIFPKDLGYILLRLSVGPGKTVIEAGTGSGALTTALAWAVGPSGRVISYDRRADMQELASRNLRRVGLEGRVAFKERDIEQGFDESEVDALFLDLPTPHLYLPQVRAALQGGGAFGAILPTTPQVATLLQAMEEHPFAFVEVCELLLRHYKPIPQRLRPTDRMVAHTGYLIFARPVTTPPEFDLAPDDEGALPTEG